MSLRRRIAIVFLAVNALTLGGLVVYILIVTHNFKKQADLNDAKVKDSTARLLGTVLTENVQRELRESFPGNRPMDDSTIRRVISEQRYWDRDAFVVEHLDKAVLVRYDENDANANTVLFNPRPRLIFENTRDFKNKVRLAVKATRDVSLLKEENVVVGRLRLPVGKTWGFYCRLRDDAPFEVDRAREVRNVFLLTVPGMALLLFLLWGFFSIYVLRPITAMADAAKRMSAGNFAEPVVDDGRRDEIGDLARTLNESMAELDLFRKKMESLVTDATDRFKKAERHLVLSQRLAAMGQLAAGIAHEINNPLGGILNALQRLGDPETTPERRKRFYEIARDAVQRIQEIVQRVLSAAPRKVSPEARPLSHLVAQAVGLVQHRAQKAEIEITVSVAPEIIVLVAPNDIIQVFLNLMINACDAIGEKGRIAITARAHADSVEIDVMDSGAGMSDDVKAHIFDFFFTTKPGTQGTGLGLGIVHSIITAHGGEISVRSAPGEGTTFTITLPLGESRGGSTPES